MSSRISTEYPELFQLLTAYIGVAWESGQYSDELIIADYLATKDSQSVVKSLEQLEDLLINWRVTWQEVTEDANRYMSNKEEVTTWLKEIYDIIKRQTLQKE
jgi:hypothetical protein